MSNFFYIMGKSSSGKDTMYKRIKEQIDINTYILYTTRPIRKGEKEGVDYHYISNEKMEELIKAGKVLESRTYQTVNGPWIYATVADEQLEQEGDIITVGTLESYRDIKEYYKDKTDTKLIPIYIFIDEQERRKRAIEREEKQTNPNYAEVERRIKADNIDFSEENLKKAGITTNETFYNYDLDRCVSQIIDYMERVNETDKNSNVVDLEER